MRAQAVLLLAISLLAGACGESPNELNARERRMVREMGLVFDPALDESRPKKLVAGDLVHLSKMEFDSRRATINPTEAKVRYYGAIFPQGPIRFLKDRIGVMLSSETNPFAILTEVPSLSAREAKVYIKASNVGVPLWWESEIYREKHGVGIGLKLGSRTIPIRSTRAGVIQLGEVFGEEMPRLDRISTLIHEARHSDCVGGLTRADLSRIRSGALPSNLQCGNIHSICPKDHEYEGYAACDEIPWGAYAVEAIFATRVAVACSSCSERERAIALMVAADRFERVMPLSRLLGGQMGDPVMTSQGLVSH